MQVAVKSSKMKLSQSKFHPLAICSLPIGSLTMQLNKPACVLASASERQKKIILIHAYALNRETFPLSHQYDIT